MITKLGLFLFGTTVVIIFGTIVIKRSRKRRRGTVYSNESFIRGRNSSWLSLVRLGKTIRFASHAQSRDDLLSAGIHPEGPNIGFNSDRSWFASQGENNSSNCDGNHGKRDKLIVALVG